MLDLGVISQIEEYLIKTFPFSSKRKESPKFLEYKEDKLNSEFYKTNWQIVFYRNPPSPINNQIKRNINFYFSQLIDDTTSESGQFIKGYCGWIGFLLKVDFILCYFLHKTDIDENNKLYQIISNYYLFLREECQKRAFEIPKPFDTSPKKRYCINKTKTEVRPNCPECNSNKIVSSGLNWICRTCGKAHRKKLRK